MDKEEIIRRLKKISGHVVHVVGEPPFIMSLDDGIALDEAVRLLKEQEAKWVEDKQGEHCRLIKCSNCGLTFIVGNNIPYDEWIEDRNYCRRCGARMEK